MSEKNNNTIILKIQLWIWVIDGNKSGVFILVWMPWEVVEEGQMRTSGRLVIIINTAGSLL